jgi:hypothetical protein
VRRSLALMWAALAVLLLAPEAAQAVPITVYSNGFESALNSGGNPGWTIGADPWGGTVLSGAAPGVVFPGSAAVPRTHAGSGSLWSAADPMGAEDWASSLDSVDAYYDVRVRITAPAGTSASALADIDAVESRYGGQWLRLESDADTTAVQRVGSWTTASGERYSPYGAGGLTSVTSVPNDYIEFLISGDATLGGAKTDNPRRSVGIIVGARGPGSGRGSIAYSIDAYNPGGGFVSNIQSWTIDEASSSYSASVPGNNRYPVLMRGYVRQPLDLRPYSGATYRVWYYMPTSLLYDPGDSGLIRVIRQDGGAVLTSQSFSLQKSRWYEWSKVLGPGTGAGEQVWLEFRWHSNDDRDSSEGLYFDDLVVSGELAPPTAPAVSSSTHPTQTVWYRNATPAFAWNVTTTVAGYSWVMDAAASTTPDQVTDGDGSVTSWQAPTQPSGDRYFHIAAVDSANQWSPTTHYRAKVDVQPPTTPSVNDGVSSWSQATTRAVTWSSSDAQSGLSRFWYGISPSALTSAPGTSTGAAMSGFPQGTSTIYVVAEDNLGSRSATGTHLVYVDTSAPSTPVVTDEGQYTPFTTRTAASWTATDTYSGVASYEYAIGTTPGGTQTRDWTSVGLATSVNAQSLVMTYGTTYYVSVRAQDGVGKLSSVGTADGITPMLAALSDPTVTDDGTSTASGGSIHGAWTAVSGAQAYRVSVGSSPLAVDLAGWGSDLPTTPLEATRSPLTIPDGTTAYFNVQGKNIFGDYGAAGASDGILVDSSPPATPTASFDGTVSASTSTVHFSLVATDPHSGLSSVSYALGTTAGGTDVKTWTSVAPASDITATGLNMGDGSQVYASVRATNMLGAIGGTGTSGALLIDSSKPDAFTLTTPTAGFWIASTQPTFTWNPVSDTGSGVRRLELVIDGSVDRTLGPGATQTTAQTALSAQGAHTWTVRAFDGAENTRTPTAETFNLDWTPPSTPMVTMTVASQFGTDHLAASWSAADTPSGVGAYEYAIGSAPGLTDVRGWTNAGLATSIDAAGLALGAPGMYHFSVRAHDLAGNVGQPGTASSGTAVKAASQAALTAPTSSVAGRSIKLIVDTGREGASVRVWQRVGTSTSLVSSLVAGANGQTSVWVKPTQHTTYWATVVEETLYGPATSASKLVRVAWSVTASARPLTARAGSSTYFSGRVITTPVGRTLYLQRKIGSVWRVIGRPRVTSSGYYIRYRTTVPRGYSYWRVMAGADSRHLTGYSSTIRLRGL